MSEKTRFGNSEPSVERDIISVDQGEWDVIEKGAIGETMGLGPCFGIIIYDTASKKALFGHFVDPRMDDFQGMLAESKKLFKDNELVKVYVGGGGPDPDDAPDYANDKEKRKFVKEELKKSGFKKVKIDYHDSTDATTMRIDTKTGIVDYETDDTEID